MFSWNKFDGDNVANGRNSTNISKLFLRGMFPKQTIIFCRLATAMRVNRLTTINGQQGEVDAFKHGVLGRPGIGGMG